MHKFREGVPRNQVMLLPRSVEEYVSEDDAVRFIDSLIEEFDLKSIEEQYSEFGRPGYSPRVLSKIILYGKIRGIRSCRELQNAARENVKFMYLANDEKPDFRTINLFRKRFCRELSELLGQTVQIALNEGMLSLEHVAVDGTKLRAYASKRSYKDPEELRETLKAIEAELQESFEKDIEADKDATDEEPTLPPELRAKSKLKEKVKKALSVYESMRSGKGKDRSKKLPKRISITDPECRYLPGDGKSVRSYNMQAAVDAKSRIVVAGYAINKTDNAEIIPILEEIEANTKGKLPKELSADRGYCQQSALSLLKQKNIVGFIPQKERSGLSTKDFIFNKVSNTYRCPDGRLLHYEKYNKDLGTKLYKCESCQGCPLAAQCLYRDSKRKVLYVSDHNDSVQEMIVRTKSQLGQEKKILRAATVETLFAHLKQTKKLARVLFRGKDMINSFWKLELTAVNLEKIVRFRINQVALVRAT